MHLLTNRLEPNVRFVIRDSNAISQFLSSLDIGNLDIV